MSKLVRTEPSRSSDGNPSCTVHYPPMNPDGRMVKPELWMKSEALPWCWRCGPQPGGSAPASNCTVRSAASSGPCTSRPCSTLGRNAREWSHPAWWLWTQGRNNTARLSFLNKTPEIVFQESVNRDSVPVISRCIELSMGSGRDRKLKGSKRALMCPHVLHFTWDLSWPWKRSTTMERFLRRWFSHACNGRNTNTGRRRRLQRDPRGRRRWAAAARADR